MITHISYWSVAAVGSKIIQFGRRLLVSLKGEDAFRKYWALLNKKLRSQSTFRTESIAGAVLMLGIEPGPR